MHPLLATSILDPIAKPVADVLAGFYSVVPNIGIAIMLLSVAWMIVIAPLTLKSTRSMLAMQKLQPELKRLQAEHKNDRQAFAQAQMDLFKEHNVSPFGSCLPSLLPLPVFFALFRVIDGLSHSVTDKATGVVTYAPRYLSSHTALFKAIAAAHGHLDAFGLDLSKNALSGHSSFAAALPFYVLLLIMIGTQYLQTVQMMARNKAAQDNPQMKFMKYIPIVFGVICVRFPAGVILYYATSNVCRIGQQTAMYRFDPKVKALVNQEIIEVESHTKDYDRKQGNVTPTQSRGLFARALAKAAEAQEQAKSDAGTRQAAKGNGAAKSTGAAKGNGAGKSNGAAKGGGQANGNGKANGNGARAKKPPAPASGATSTPSPKKASPGGGAGGQGSNGAGRATTAGAAPDASTPGTGGTGDNGSPAPATNGGRTGAGRTGAQAGRSRKRRS